MGWFIGWLNNWPFARTIAFIFAPFLLLVAVLGLLFWVFIFVTYLPWVGAFLGVCAVIGVFLGIASLFVPQRDETDA